MMADGSVTTDGSGVLQLPSMPAWRMRICDARTAGVRCHGVPVPKSEYLPHPLVNERTRSGAISFAQGLTEGFAC